MENPSWGSLRSRLILKLAGQSLITAWYWQKKIVVFNLICNLYSISMLNPYLTQVCKILPGTVGGLINGQKTILLEITLPKGKI